MNRQALSRTALWWIILVLILLAIALYFSYRERARFSPDESSSVAAAIKNPTECPSSPSYQVLLATQTRRRLRLFV